MISLPERTDKRDAFAVQAAVSGISYQMVDGVDGTKVPSKALPYASHPTNSSEYRLTQDNRPWTSVRELLGAGEPT